MCRNISRSIYNEKRWTSLCSAIDGNPQGAEGLAVVPIGKEELVKEAAEECPGECIFYSI